MPDYFEFEVSLLQVEPRIWRRFLLRKAETFRELHKAIQDACGWQGYHLFEFRMGGRMGRALAGMPDQEEQEDCGSYPGYERCVRVAGGEESGIDELDGVDLKRWMGEWDPEFFNLKSVKRVFDR